MRSPRSSEGGAAPTRNVAPVKNQTIVILSCLHVTPNTAIVTASMVCPAARKCLSLTFLDKAITPTTTTIPTREIHAKK